MNASGKFFHLAGEQWLLKGMAYGPFDGPDGLPGVAQVERDLSQIASLGCNTLRVYVPPPRWFFDACAAAGLRVLVGWPWPSHTDFLRTRSGRRRILREAAGVVRQLRGAPAVLGFVIGNEVPSVLVRWMGMARVQRFLECLIAACRREAPDSLFAYASFPSTEYLNPRNADFLLCNIYLEDRLAYARYLARLQLVAGDRPLVVGEFGLDSRQHGEPRQAESLGWAWGTAGRAGLAGQIVFSFTDEWFNQGRRMDPEWAFGVTRADRQPKEAAAALAALLPSLRRAGQAVRPRRLPRFSVIVCTHNGAATLRHALESLQALPYPDYEVLLVNDGSTDPAVETIASEFRDVRSFRLAHGGLSRARNFGASQASGTHLVYLDDDAAAEPDWLSYLALAFDDDRVGAAGGPNIPPTPKGWKQAAIAAAPGGPAVVMLNDVDAEHVPGCNLAVTRAAWEEVGGFDDRHRAAGDDVDFCWRLIEHGYRIAYHPGAMVWHERRQTVAAYFRQQNGYGRAEAALIAQHPHRFGAFGGALWRGVIYDATAPAGLGGSIIYAGVFGTAPYQFLYSRPPSPWLALATGPPWIVASAAATLAGLWSPWLGTAGALGLAPSLWLAARIAVGTRLPQWPGKSTASTVAARTLIGILAWAQPISRGLVRRLACHRTKARPTGTGRLGPLLPAHPSPRRKAVAETAYWASPDCDRNTLLTAIIHELNASNWPVHTGDAWADWDLEVSHCRWWSVRLVTTTEYHAPSGQLIRVRWHTRARRPTVVLAAVSLGTAAILLVTVPKWGLWALATTFLLWLALEHRHGAEAARLVRLVTALARHLGLKPAEDPPS